MSSLPIAPRHVQGTVLEVLPATGLAYITDDQQRSWAVTRSTRGAGLTSLRPGQRLDLTVVDHTDFDVVSDYAPLD
jgi:hypothetical protein